jgi:hypothetical protein
VVGEIPATAAARLLPKKGGVTPNKSAKKNRPRAMGRQAVFLFGYLSSQGAVCPALAKQTVKIRLRGLPLRRTYWSPEKLREHNEAGQRSETAWSNDVSGEQVRGEQGESDRRVIQAKPVAETVHASRRQELFEGGAINLDNAVPIHHFLRRAQVQAFPSHLHGFIGGPTDRNAPPFSVIDPKKLLPMARQTHALC